MTLKAMNRILGDFPWLWAIQDSWNAELCDFKIVTRRIDKVDFTEMLGDFLRDRIDVHVHTSSGRGQSVSQLGKLPFGPDGRLIESDLFLSQDYTLRHIAVEAMSTAGAICLNTNFTIFRIRK